MRRVTGTYVIPAETREQTDTFCDSCGEPFAEITTKGGWRNDDGANVGMTEHNVYATGEVQVERYDCCLRCYRSLIVPLFKTGPERR